MGLLLLQCVVTDPLFSSFRLGSKLLLNLIFFRGYQRAQRLQRERRWRAQEQLLQHREQLAAEALAKLDRDTDSVDGIGEAVAERARLKNRLSAIAQTRQKIQVERDLAAQQLLEKPRPVLSTGFEEDSGRVEREALACVDTAAHVAKPGAKTSFACVHPINDAVLKHRERAGRRASHAPVVHHHHHRHHRHHRHHHHHHHHRRHNDGHASHHPQQLSQQHSPRLYRVPSGELILHPLAGAPGNNPVSTASDQRDGQPAHRVVPGKRASM